MVVERRLPLQVVRLGLVLTYMAVGDGSLVPSTNRTTLGSVVEVVILLPFVVLRKILGNGRCACDEDDDDRGSSPLVSVIDAGDGVSTIDTSKSL
jgi:hypothetical protein